MSSDKERLPLEIILEISKFLLIKEYFLELESVIYLFPQLEEYFGYKFPTIAVIGIDQYDKCKKFMHTRKRSFGSKDLFIILQTYNDHSGIPAGMLDSKCYMILGSKMSQNLVPEAFKKHSDDDEVIMVEGDASLDDVLHHDDSYKCYQLVHRVTYDDEKFFKSDGYANRSVPFNYSFKVVQFAHTFLMALNPSMFRFESYTGFDQLTLDYQLLYSLYTFLNNSKMQSELFFPSFHICEDSVLKTPKCCFEIIKSVKRMTHLYQKLRLESNVEAHDDSSSFNQYFPFKFATQGISLMKWFMSFFQNNKSASTYERIGVFQNVNEAKVDIFNYSADRQNDFISIDCSKAATENTNAYEFMENCFSYIDTGVPRFIDGKHSTELIQDLVIIRAPEEIMMTNEAETSTCNENSQLEYFIKLRYQDFFAQQLQYLDLISFDPTVLERSTQEYGSLTNHESESFDRMNLKDLEVQINSSFNDIVKANLRYFGESVFLLQKTAAQSHYIMTTIVQRTLKVSTLMNGLNGSQPFRIRMFNNHTDSLNRAEEIKKIKEWYNDRMC